MESSFLEKLYSALSTFDDWLWGNWLLFVLIGVGVLYTAITGGVQIRCFGYVMRDYVFKPLKNKKHDSAEKGTITSFQALCTALASCVGSGNIVGVSTAVLAGGMGALFWMWVAAFVGMATKFGEIVLGMLYRRKNDAGEYVGGPFYYIEKGLHAPLLATLTALFMVIQIIGGNFIQSNTISGILRSTFNIPELYTGIALVVLIFVIAIGGLKRLAHTAQRMVPVMAVLYIFSGLIIIIVNIKTLPAVIASIFKGAFSLQAAAGGAAGTVMRVAMQKGVARGLYSNEAGEGSAPVLHSAASVQHPVQQGLTGIAEVFFDTFVLCTMSGLIIGVTGMLNSGHGAPVLVAEAFATLWEPMRYLVIISLLLFCTSTLMSQWYFGFVGLNYIFGFKTADSFKYIFPLFCVIGATMKLELVWVIQDIALGFLTIPNLLAMIFLFPQVHRSTVEFFKSGLYQPGK